MTTEIKKEYDEKNSLCKFWYKNGQLEIDCTYDIDKNHGLCKFWYENGKLRYKFTYVKDGFDKKHGLYKAWYENGQPEEECTYVNGKKHGLYKLWYNNNQLKEECTYVNDKKHGLCKFWYVYGQPWKKCTYDNGKKHGLYKEWSATGILGGYDQLFEETYYYGTRYPHILLPILQRKAKAKILLRKFKTLIKTEGFQQAWMDPTCFGGYWHKQRLLKNVLSM